MSAVLISLLPVLLKHTPDLIKAIEGIFGGKPKSGTDKAATLLEWARTLVTKLIAAKIPLPDGTILTEQPTDEHLAAALETIFQGMKINGDSLVLPTSGQERIYLVRESNMTALK